MNHSLDMIPVLVTGARGQLGDAIRRRIYRHPNYAFTLTDIDELDLCDKKAVLDFVRRGRYAYIINCAAYTAVDRAESLDELSAMLGIAGVRSQVDDEGGAVGVRDVDAVDDRADGRCGVDESGDRLLGGGHLEMQSDGVAGAGLSHVCVPSEERTSGPAGRTRIVTRSVFDEGDCIVVIVVIGAGGPTMTAP